MENQNREPTQDEVIEQKLLDVETPGYAVAFDPDEADRLAIKSRIIRRNPFDSIQAP